MRIKVNCSTNVHGSEVVDYLEIVEEDLEGMPKSEAFDYLEEIAREHVFDSDMLSWGWSVEADE